MFESCETKYWTELLHNDCKFATADLLTHILIVFVRYRQVTDNLQLERDALHASVASQEVQLRQQSAELQQLHDKVQHDTIHVL